MRQVDAEALESYVDDTLASRDPSSTSKSSIGSWYEFPLRSPCLVLMLPVACKVTRLLPVVLSYCDTACHYNALGSAWALRALRLRFARAQVLDFRPHVCTFAPIDGLTLGQDRPIRSSTVHLRQGARSHQNDGFSPPARFSRSRARLWPALVGGESCSLGCIHSGVKIAILLCRSFCCAMMAPFWREVGAVNGCSV